MKNAVKAKLASLALCAVMLTTTSTAGAVVKKPISINTKPAINVSKVIMPVFTRTLDSGKWYESNRKQVQDLIDKNGIKSKNYNAKNKPYAVFDWDNTCIMNDTEEALFTYQIDNLEYKMTPEEFAKVVVKGVPDGNFAESYKNAEGKQINLSDISTDVISDYTYLYNNYKGLAGKMTLGEVRATEQFKDYKAKLWLMYEAIGDTYGTDIGYPWVIYLFENMTMPQLSDLVERSNDTGIGGALEKVTFTSSATLQGKTGVVSVKYSAGVRTVPEIADLMHTFNANGIDVYIVSASLEDVVRVFASNSKYGYNVKPENVIGLRLEKKDGKFTSQYAKDWAIVVKEGKVVTINKELTAKHAGKGPILIAGDSDGDYNMMTEIPSVQKVLVINRIKGGNIGKVCKEGIEKEMVTNPKFLVQGRDENTGLWLPCRETVKIGKAVKELLPQQ